MAILELPKITTQTDGVSNEMFFDIGNKGIVFEILRSKLYADPIKGLVREYSTNARDAHVEAKKPSVPVELYLPTWDNPYFKIVDHGLGISKERIEEIFIKFGNSTKRNDASQTGMFGIGSKSGFAYTDQFSISTICDGKKRVYSAYIDESRVGKLALLSEENTKESNGTTISIPVKKSDYSKFISSVKEATQFWDVRPKIMNSSITYDEYTYLHSGTDWAIYKHRNMADSYYSKKETFVVIDGIYYAIDSTNFDTSDQEVLRNPFMLKFKGGELSLSASRDTIHFDAKTKKAIQDKVAVVFKEFGEIIAKNVANAKTYREAIKTYNDTYSILSNKLLTSKLPPIKWKTYDVIPAPTVQNITANANQPIKVSGYYKSSSYSYKKNTYTNQIQSKSYGRYDNLSLLDDAAYEFYHVDKEVPRLRSYAEYLFDNGVIATNKNLVFIHTPEMVINDKGVEEKAKYNMHFLELFEIKKISSIKIPAKAKQARTKFQNDDKKVTVYVLTNSFGGVTSGAPIEIDNKGGIYVLYDYKDRSLKYDNNGKLENLNLNGVSIGSLSAFLGDTIYGITETRAKHLSDKWKDLKTVLDAKIDEQLAKTPLSTLEVLAKDVPHVNSVSSNGWWVIISNKDFVKQLTNDKSPLKELLTTFDSVKEKYKEYNNFMELLRKYRNHKSLEVSSYSIKGNGSKFEELSLKILRECPLLPLLDSWTIVNDQNAIKHCVNYVNAIYK